MNRFLGAIICFAAMTIFSVSIAQAATFSNASLKGRYSFVLNAWSPDATVTQSAVLGLGTFDGAGNVTGNYVSLQGPPSGASTAALGAITGTYSVNPDGTGNITFTSSLFAGSVNVALRLDASAGGVARGAQLLLVTPNPDGTVNSGLAVQQSPLPKSFTASNLKGTFSYVQNKWTASTASGSAASIGILSFDGKGHVTNNLVGMMGSTGPTTGSLSGTYTVNSDGTGTISYTNGASFAFVITGNGKELQTVSITTHNPGNFILSQTALKQ